MIELAVNGKTIETAAISSLIVQGESNANRISIRIPRIYNQLDLNSLGFVLAGTTDKETRVEQTLTKTVDGDSLVLIWEVAERWAAISGKMNLELTGQNPLGDVIIKFTGSPIAVIRSLDIYDEPPIDTWSQYLNDVRGLAVEASESAEDAQLAADRYPYIGENLNWYVYDADQNKFVDSGITARGQPLSIVGEYPTLEALNTEFPEGDGTNSYYVSGDVYSWTGEAWRVVINSGMIPTPIAQGGTGAIDAASALVNLGAAHKIQYGLEFINVSTVLDVCKNLEQPAQFFAPANTPLFAAQDSPAPNSEVQYTVCFDGVARRTVVAYLYGGNQFAVRYMFYDNWTAEWAFYRADGQEERIENLVLVEGFTTPTTPPLCFISPDGSGGACGWINGTFQNGGVFAYCQEGVRPSAQVFSSGFFSLNDGSAPLSVIITIATSGAISVNFHTNEARAGVLVFGGAW